MLCTLLLTLIPSADAADFGGKIKRIRIRPTNTGGDYRLIVVGESNNNDPDDSNDGGTFIFDFDKVSTSTTFAATNGGPSIADVTSEDWIRQRRTFTSSTLTGISATTAVVAVGEESVTLTLEAPAEGSKKGAWVAESTETYNISARIEVSGDGETGQIVVQVKGMDKSTDLDDIDSITLTADDEAPLDSNGTTRISLAIDKARAQSATLFTATEGTASLDGYSYDYTTTLYSDGEVIDTRTGSVVIGGDGATRGVYSSKVKQKKNGNLKHTMFTVSDAIDSNYSIDVLIGGRADGESLLSATGETSVDTERHFTIDTLAFDGTPAGEVYSLTVYPLSEAGDVVGEPVDLELAMGTSGSEALSVWDAGFAALQTSGDSLNVALAGDALESVASVEVVFNEPFDGPDPIETNIEVSMGQEWTRFVQTARVGDADLSDGVDVEIYLYDEQDGLLDSMIYGGSLGGKQGSTGEVLFKPSLIGLDQDGV